MMNATTRRYLDDLPDARSLAYGLRGGQMRVAAAMAHLPMPGCNIFVIDLSFLLVNYLLLI